MHDPYWRQCRILSVTDGDTLRITVDLGYRCYADHAVRLLGVDAPERRGETRIAGLAAARYVEDWLVNGHLHAFVTWPFRIRSEKADSFGRYLGVIECVEGHVLNDDLIAAGHATVYAGREV